MTTNKVYAASVLAGAYKGKDISERALLSHAVSDTVLSAGRLKRRDGEAFCDKSLDVVDAGAWTPADDITCPKCIEIVARIQSKE